MFSDKQVAMMATQIVSTGNAQTQAFGLLAESVDRLASGLKDMSDMTLLNNIIGELVTVLRGVKESGWDSDIDYRLGELGFVLE